MTFEVLVGSKSINFGSVIANIALITKRVLRPETINWDKLSFFLEDQGQSKCMRECCVLISECN